MHIDRALVAGQSQLTVDVEYSRVLLGINRKEAPSGQIFPDLIVHRRGEPDGNLLAVEVKPGVPPDSKTVDADDDRKICHLTAAEWMAGQSAYVRGACLQLAHDRARLHWYEAGRPILCEDWALMISSMPERGGGRPAALPGRSAGADLVPIATRSSAGKEQQP